MAIALDRNPNDTDSDVDKHRTLHIYLPWSMPGEEGLPPIGTKALCGHIRDTDSPNSGKTSDPRTCIVCLELFELWQWQGDEGEDGEDS